MAQSSTKVRIVGGGLTGVLAALQAHSVGWREIELHERFGELGGTDLPRRDHGLELCSRLHRFGGPGDPVRALLESHGLAFEDAENRAGSLSPTPCGDMAVTHDFAGPALRTRQIALSAPTGDSLADRLRAYPSDIAQPLTRYLQWRLGAWLDEVHAAAAVGLGVDQVFPTGGDVADLALARRACPLHAELYAIPRTLCGRLDDTVVGVPTGGVSGLFAAASRALERLGVSIKLNSLVSPGQALADHAPGDALVWTADPAPLFALAGLEAPRQVGKSLATHVFKARYAGPVPFLLRNFTAQGAVCEIHLYESRGQVLLTARCVTEASDADLRREIHRLMSSFGGASLSLGEQMLSMVGPQESCLTIDGAQKLQAMRIGLQRRFGAGFVDAGWACAQEGERLDSIATGLSQARVTPETVAA
ncbi:MAG: flagellin modification protein FlmF [Pseudomonadota bacterium]